MVTAGVYMVARFHFLYSGIEEIGLFIAYIGAFSALLAAIIATRQTDIKKFFAYSTMSQLGYMFIGGWSWIFTQLDFFTSLHTHSLKAMLFMGAGGIIIALHHEQNIFKIRAT